MKNKNLTLLIGTIFLLLPLSSCNNNSSDRNNHSGKKTLTYLVSSESTVYTNILNDLLSEFNETIKDDGYEIVTEVPGGEYYQSLGNKFASRKAPDIFQMEIGYFNAYKKYMAPLDEYIDASTLLKTSDLWNLNDSYKYEGTYRALIKDFSPDFMLIYNKTQLDSYNASHPDNKIEISTTKPMTWKKFYEIASTIQNEMNVQYGTSLGFEGIKHLHELVQSTNSSMYKDDGTKLNKDDVNVRNAFEFYCALQKDNATELTTYYDLNKSSTHKAPASYTSGSNTSEFELFKQQKTFSIFNGLYSFPAYGFYDTSFEVGIAPHPVINEDSPAYGSTSAMVSHAISSTSKYKDIAYKWLEFYQTEGLKRFAKIAYNIPGNKTIAGSDYFLKNDDPKVEKMTNYFYNYVASGAVHVTEYNPNISFSRVQTCFQTHFGKYYDNTNTLSFNQLIDEIDKSIQASV